MDIVTKKSLILEILNKFKEKIREECFKKDKKVKNFKFNEWSLELDYPFILTVLNDNKKSLLFRNLFSIIDFNNEDTNINKENDPIKFYFICKKFLIEIGEKIYKAMKELEKLSILTNKQQLSEDNVKNWIKQTNEETKKKFNIDLTFCNEPQSITTSKRGYIKNKMGNSFEYYFKLKELAKKIEIKNNIEMFFSKIKETEELKNVELMDLDKSKYKHPDGLDEIKIRNIFQEYLENLAHLLEKTLLDETVTIKLDNKEDIDYPKIFIQLRGHDLEEIIYRTVFRELIHKQILIYFSSSKASEIFIPFELKRNFENLSKLFIELNENNFEQMVFNSNICWFVKFIGKPYMEFFSDENFTACI